MKDSSLDTAAAVEIQRLENVVADLRQKMKRVIDGTWAERLDAEKQLATLVAEREKLTRELAALKVRVEEVDRKAEKQTDEDDWITGYTLPVGPWHRLLAEARS